MEEAGPVRLWFQNFWAKLTRRKVIADDIMKTDLSRALSPLSVIMIGISQMAGGGAFVVLGTATLLAGPGVVLSFAVGGIVAFVTGMCYAEFAATIPRAGSGYLFSYVTLGEFVAFIVGWQVILENLICASSMASAISAAINSMTDKAISNWTIENIGAFNQEILAPYPDLLALGVGLVVVVAMCFGVSNSILISNVLIGVQMCDLVFSIIACFVFANPANWTFAGFMPYGFNGVMKGAAASFYAYIGFEAVACTGEETANPQKTIPMALFSSLGVCSVLYILQAMALTLMVPFNKVDPESAFPEAFKTIGYSGIGNLIALGIIIGLIGGLISCLYTMTRITYAMSQDGLLFKIFSKVNKRTKTPLVGEITFGVLAAALAVIFNLEILVQFLSVGTLMTYTIVAACSIILHYQSRVTVYDMQRQKNMSLEESQEEERDQAMAGTLKPQFRFLRFLELYPGFIVDIAVLLFAIFVGGFFAAFIYVPREILSGQDWAIAVVVVMAIGFIAAYLLIVAHRKRRLKLPYNMPCIPFVPALSVALNIMLMAYLSGLTWLRFAVWLALGLLIYFTYGIRKSTLADENRDVRTGEDYVEPIEDIVRDPMTGQITDIPGIGVEEKMPLIGRARNNSSISRNSSIH